MAEVYAIIDKKTNLYANIWRGLLMLETLPIPKSVVFEKEKVHDLMLRVRKAHIKRLDNESCFKFSNKDMLDPQFQIVRVQTVDIDNE